MADPGDDDLDRVFGALASARRPLLLGLDIDGTLSPIVARADQARLVDGALEAITSIAARDGVHVALITGRSVADARATFGVPDTLAVVGSHGREMPGDESDDEPGSGGELEALVDRAEAMTADVEGAWVERKPFSVTVHVRQADPEAGASLLRDFEAAARHAGATVLHGSAVVEAGFGPLDKGAALDRLRKQTGAATVCFVGDDVTDEHAFARLGPSDVAVKVGDADALARSQARWRLDGPNRVALLLARLVEQV